MDEKRDILLQLRYAKQNIEHAKSLIIQDGLFPVIEFQDNIKAAISSLKTVDSIIFGEGKERGSERRIVTFSVGDRTYKFKEHLMLESEYAEDGICLTHKGLSLSACGKSFSECEGIIRDQLAVIWMTYSITPDNRLTSDAIVFKKKLLGMVEEVKPQR